MEGRIVLQISNEELKQILQQSIRGLEIEDLHVLGVEYAADYDGYRIGLASDSFPSTEPGYTVPIRNLLCTKKQIMGFELD